MSDFAPGPYGRYTLLRKIATGGMAEIFLARQQGPGRFERSLVIKRILPHLAADAQFVEMFLDEAALAAQLNHPHIGQVYDFGEAEGSFFIAMELIRGPDLRTLLAACTKLRQAPPVEVSLRLITQVLSALDYAHGATDEQGVPFNLVHRDVTPQNILVTPEGMAKLVDFGIAKAATASHQTQAGMVKGKLAYLAPEQVTAQVLDARCDQYAAGLVLYDLLTLHRALPVTGPEGLMVAVEARITPITTYRTDLPPALLDILSRALAKRREDRFPDCRSLAVAIDELLVAQGIAVADRNVAAYLHELEQLNGQPLSGLAAPLPPSALDRTDLSLPRATELSPAPLDPEAGRSTLTIPPSATPAPVLKKPIRNRLPSQAQLLEALAKANAANGVGQVLPSAPAKPEIDSFTNLPAVEERPVEPGQRGAPPSSGGNSLVGGLQALLAVAFLGAGIMLVIEQGAGVVSIVELLVLGAVGLWLGARAMANLRPPLPDFTDDRGDGES